MDVDEESLFDDALPDAHLPDPFDDIKGSALWKRV
jgi:hypothetical protein